jgi:hypothetical protein
MRQFGTRYTMPLYAGAKVGGTIRLILLSPISLSLMTLGLIGGSSIVARAQSPATGATQPSCTAAEHRQFDFWVGRWDVYPKKMPQKLVAHSFVEKLYSGCAIRENWMPIVAGRDGGSLNSYRPVEGVWRQMWADTSGAWVEFTGKWNGAAMVLEGTWPQPDHPKQRTRMTYKPLPDGSVEQSGESSDDEGKTWQPSFDLIYRPASEEDAHE